MIGEPRMIGTSPSMLHPPETTVAPAGDWHGNTLWACAAIQMIGEYRPEVETILHLGGFGIYPSERAGRRYLAAVEQAVSDALAAGSQPPSTERTASLARPGDRPSRGHSMSGAAPQPAASQRPAAPKQRLGASAPRPPR
ncbi:hypothetical protein [Agromyces mediolanus]|uniref:hypothetical protein n=1 Tax=Agromyces mediolanus TaxID=41986 RepID=UPI001E4180FF|nr:hypothetical protein [Agromyces mediolanus]MCD1569903.1 hypothetical protein [Agromyces mediolanus]